MHPRCWNCLQKKQLAGSTACIWKGGQNMMHYQHTTKKAAAAAVTVSILAGGIFLTSRKSEAAVPAANTALSEQKETEQTAAPGFGQLQDDPSLHETLPFSTVLTAFAQHTAAEIDFRRYTNSRREDYDDALNYALVFTFSFERETYQLRVSYDKETDQLMDIDITRLSNGQMQWIYTMDEEQGERYPNDLQTFLDTKTEIGDLLTLRLPQGYTLGSYLGNVGNYGGALISPKAYDLKIEDSFAPIHWIYAGFAGEAREDMFVFENGKLNPDYFPHSNHSIEIPIGILDNVSPGTGWTTLFVRGVHDLYTASDLAELDLAGEDLRSLETQSKYWYFYFVKEGSPKAYVLSLSAKEFTKSKAIRIARTVKITEDEAMLTRSKALLQAVDPYLQDFLQTLRSESDRVYLPDDFAGMDGYITAKWMEATREFYKKEYGGIHAVDVHPAELVQLKEDGDSLTALVRAAYSYSWEAHAETNARHIDALFRVKLERAGSGWRVTDLELRNCPEIILFNEQLERRTAGMEEADKYLLTDQYFGQIYENMQ